MKKILTIIFDGFGLREEEEGNAVKAANMRTFNNFFDNNPHAMLYASEESVGLLPGQMGNSEVGHMTIGAGRLLKSNKELIKDFFKNDLSDNEGVQNLLANKDKKVHIMGLCSDGNVHAGIDDILSMYNLLAANGFQKIYFHVITDGRDTQVNVAYNYIEKIEKEIKKYSIGSIATVCGRYYAMDRDSNYDRTKIYYDLVTKGIGSKIINVKQALESSYEKGVTDEFIKPLVLDSAGMIGHNDIIMWMNFRVDRAKQILSCFTDNKFVQFPVIDNSNIEVYSFFQIDKAIKTNVLVGGEIVDNPLGIYLSKLGLTQARIAESEKFPHVTYFFDGGISGKIPNVDKFHVASPSVSTYDQKPEMSAIQVTKKIVDCMEKDYDFILANFANPDMVGHTGDMDAATKACITLDVCLNKIIEKAEENFYKIILLADHGNADTMVNDDGSICTTHSLAKVPFVINDPKIELLDSGDLTQVAPTILDYMDISIPSQMTADSLIKSE